jgi:hypothetical protein
VKRTLPTILAILVAALTVAAAALAAVSVKPGTTFSGTTAHKHYAISVGAKCSTKKCSTANAALVIVTAGSRRAPSTSACEFAGYALPLAKISSGKFSATQKFFEPKGPVSFTVSGKFTSATKVTGTVVGSQSCGGKDTFSLKGRPNTGPTGLTR